jgi:hypothetical protein
MSTKMPIVDVEENIKELRMNIEQATQEVFRLQGMLRTFEGFKRGGLKQIEMPNDPNQSTETPAENTTNDTNQSTETPAENTTNDTNQSTETPAENTSNDILSALTSNPTLIGAALSALGNQSEKQDESTQEKPE